MSKQTHTPGPWAAHRHKSTDSYTIHVAGRSWEAYAVADVGDCVQNEANARLIAAAPELLRVMGVVASGLEADGRTLDGMTKAVAARKLRAAIAKATAG